MDLRGLDAEATYELCSDMTGATTRVTGAALMAGYALTIAERHRSDLIVYRKAQN